MDELTLTEIVTLAALADKARYGYEMVDRISEITEGRVRVRPGNLYRVIDRLIEQQLIIEVAAPPHVDARRRYFRATAHGQRAAATHLAMYSRVMKRVAVLRDVLANG
jgi:DNA-binding PadR family transcriptional regulator